MTPLILLFSLVAAAHEPVYEPAELTGITGHVSVGASPLANYHWIQPAVAGEVVARINDHYAAGLRVQSVFLPVTDGHMSMVTAGVSGWLLAEHRENVVRPALTAVLGGARDSDGKSMFHAQAGAGLLFEPGPVRFALMIRGHRTGPIWAAGLELGLGFGWRK